MTLLESLSPRSGWYAVRCIFESNRPPLEPGDLQIYEERITIWQAARIDDAIALAEAETEQYAETVTDSPSRYLGLAQAYILFDVPEHGAEVFSLMRSSRLDAEDYLDAFFDTGSEHQGATQTAPHELPPGMGTRRTPRPTCDRQSGFDSTF